MEDKFKLPIKQFAQGVWCAEDGTPSVSRILTTVLSIGSLLIISFAIRHMMYLPADKLGLWIDGMPYIIGALALFSTSPYGTSQLTGIFNRKGVVPTPDPAAPPQTGTTQPKG